VSTIGEKPERKYQLVTPALAEGGLSPVTKVTNTYSADNNKNDQVRVTEDWRLIMNVYMRNDENHMRDERQWKIDNGTSYNLVLQHCGQ
jgi:hypothetical protein